MGDEDLVVAVRLCDTNEAEQPDPLCLRPDDLETWRHFEALLRGMYRNPPETISVTYLDDENDWVQVGSDAELLEAVRIAKQAGDILQLQVKKMDTEQLINFENTDSSCTDNTDAGHFVLYIPTTDPGGEGLQPLVYPHPSVDQSSAVDGAKLNPAVAQNEPQWLVYPHHTENIEFPLLHESANHNPCQKLTTSKSLDELEAPKERNNSSIDRGQADDKSFVPLWEEAAGLSTEDKLKFMKNFIGLNSHEANGLQGHKKPEGESNTERRLLKENRKMSIEPLCLEQGSLGKNFIPNQDPFEVDSNVFSKYFEHVMINFEKDKSPTLTPKQAITNKCESNVSYIRTSSIETDGASSVSNVELCPTKQMQDMLVPSPLCQTTQQTRASYTSALPKSKVLKRVPVPMPRNLLMMEGAQSGANAVAIEIPSESADFFQGVSAVNKEEEIAASGGAASTSASEETGEVMARGGSVAAAVSREVKDSSTVVEMYSVPGDGSRSHKSEKKVKRSSSKTKHSSCKKEKALEKKLDSGIDGARPKSSEKSERRSSEHRKKPEETPVKEVKKDEKKIKVTEDVESGEKVNVKKETTALSRSDFAKYMKRTKKELHSAIVKDVARLTETYFSKVVDKTSLESLINDVFGVKDPTYHQGVFCDGCNKEICGIRYKCGNCLDFDLCCFCENKPNLHDSSHVFLKLRYPARRAGIGDDQKYSLLVENIYEAEAIKSLVLENTQEMCGDGCHHNYTGNGLPCEYCASSVMPTANQKKDKKLAPDMSQNCESHVDTENGPSSNEDDLDINCGVCEVDASVDLILSNTTPVRSPKEIVESIPMTKLQASTPCTPKDLTDDAECEQQSPTLSDSSSSSVVPVSPPEMIPLCGEPTASTGEIAKCTCWDCQSSHNLRAALYSLAVFDDEMDDIPELISEETMRHLKPDMFHDDDEDDQGNSSSFEDMGSEWSDDFCVIEPPEAPVDRSEYVALVSDVEEEEETSTEKVTESLAETVVENLAEKLAEDRVEVEVENLAEEIVEVYCDAVRNTMEAETIDPKNETLEVEEETLLSISSSGLVDAGEVNSIKKEEVEEEKIVDIEEKGCEKNKDTSKQENEKKVEKVTAKYPFGAVSVDGLVHTMNEEEKTRFAQLLRAEMDKEYEWELKRRAFELETELKLQKEKEFQLILEAKERAAALENERLEWAAQKNKEEERLCNISRQTSLSSVSSVSDDGFNWNKKDADCQTVPEPLSPAGQVIQNVASGVSRAATTAFYTAKDVFYSLQAKQTEWKNSSYNCKPPHSDYKLAKNPLQQATEHTDGLKAVNSPLLLSTASAEVNTINMAVQSNDLVGNVEASTNPVECHETGDGSRQTTDILQCPETTPNLKPAKVAHPRPTNCWIPPKSSFKFPTSTWTPPKDDYIPPTSTWTSPKHEFIPPNIEWITAGQSVKTNATGADADKMKEGKGTESESTTAASEPQEPSRRPSITASSQKAPPFTTLEIADTALRREILGMQRLIEMGFANREKNRQLLNKFDNDLEKVVQSLLQEESETDDDSHWAFNRH